MTASPTPQGEPAGELVVSVVIPTRNRCALLREALEAIFQQTLDASQFEIIVVDNRSTDETAAMIQELAATAPCDLRFHVMEVNRGPAPSRNKGVELARGGIIAFTDSDCRPQPDWLERGIAAFDDPDVALVTGSILFKPEQPRHFFSRLTSETCEENLTYPTANSLFRRRVFLELGGFNPSLCFSDLLGRAVECADSDLAWRVKKAGHRNVFVPEMVVHHELELQTPVQWLTEPFRLVALPALVRRHPELRKEFLLGRVFFYRGSLYLYAGLLGLALTLLVHWTFVLLATPFVAWKVRNALRKRPRSLLQIPLLVGQAGLHFVRLIIICLTLLFASIRFRTLVL